MIEQEKFQGNILLFYSYDIGNDVDFDLIRKKGLVKERLVALSPYFKNYNIPFSFEMPESEDELGTECIGSKIYRFGVLSFCYKISFEDSFDGLKSSLIQVYDTYRKKSDINAKFIFDKILSSIEKPTFYHIKNSYFVVNVVPPKFKISPNVFRERYGDTIASLLRLETTRLSDYQREEIFSATTGYSGEDFLIIDSEASFMYDDDYQELLDFFELATIKQLQLQYFDLILDKKLEYFYSRPYNVPLLAYVPLLSGRTELPEQQLARLRVDISVITERLESSINLAGDAYFSHVYSMLEKKLFLPEWKRAIDGKLEIIRDLYTVYQHRLETIHAEMLEVVIILLIALEIILALVKS